MRTLNLGILAHVDAGKTTLTEQLLFTAGAIDHVGSVDAGTTQTDSLELERERGITIRSAVASFRVDDLAVNLVDTPGHPDFIAEVERVLGVLDGAVLVVSAVEGVQPQTPLLFRALQRLHVPTLIFVNKTDRAGADPKRVVEEMGRRLSPAMIPMSDIGVQSVVLTETLADQVVELRDGRIVESPDSELPRLEAPLASAHGVLRQPRANPADALDGADVRDESRRRIGHAWKDYVGPEVGVGKMLEERRAAALGDARRALDDQVLSQTPLVDALTLD